MSNCTSAECLSFEIWPAAPGASGERTSSTFRSSFSRVTTRAIVCRNAGSLVVAVCDWTRTLSAAGCENPASARICCALADSPVDCSASVSLTEPTADPTTIAATTNASHPKVAVFQWAALHFAARAAKVSFDTLNLPVTWLFTEGARAAPASVRGLPGQLKVRLTAPRPRCATRRCRRRRARSAPRRQRSA